MIAPRIALGHDSADLPVRALPTLFIASPYTLLHETAKL